MKKIGFTIGKFAPLHKGHQYLIEKALQEMDEFYVVIYETDLINIPIEKRANWIKQLYPTVKILYAYNPPVQYGLDKQSIEIQMKHLKNIIGNIPFTHFYNSEEYGRYVVENLKIQEVLVDKDRKIQPICASNIRKNIVKYKKYVEDIVLQDIQ